MTNHIDAHTWNCPACIASPLSGDELIDEHAAAVVKLRANAAATPWRPGTRNTSPTAGGRSRGAKR